MAGDDEQAGGGAPGSFSDLGNNAFAPAAVSASPDGEGSSFDDAASFPEFSGDGGSAGDSFTETRHVSWGEKLMESLVGVGLGILLVLATAFLLFWNEGRAVQTFRSLNEGAGLVVEAEAGRVDPAHEGKLVHVAGDLSATTPVSDRAIGIEAMGARLVRHVEMFQWKEESRTETHKRVGGGEDRTTTYTYTRVWHDSRYDSDRFHNGSGHQNPAMRFSRFEATAPDARLGEFRPSAGALHLLPDSEPQPIPAQAEGQFPRELGPAHVTDGGLFLGQNPSQPRVGDLRITYRLAPLGPVSFIGRQTGRDLQEYQTKAGDKLLLARAGLVPSAAMFAQAQAENTAITWLLRAAGTIFMWVGFFLILRPLAVIGDVVPFVGDMLGIGAGLAAFALTLLVAPVVVAIAWFAFRPFVSLAVLAVGAGVVYGLRRLAASRRQAPAVLMPPPLPATAPPPLPTTA